MYLLSQNVFLFQILSLHLIYKLIKINYGRIHNNQVDDPKGV